MCALSLVDAWRRQVGHNADAMPRQMLKEEHRGIQHAAAPACARRVVRCGGGGVERALEQALRFFARLCICIAFCLARTVGPLELAANPVDLGS